METYLKQIRLLLKELSSINLLSDLRNAGDMFYDEPKLFLYLGFINSSSSYYKAKGYVTAADKILTCGPSFRSRYIALLKCLGESIERLCLYMFKPDSIVFSSYNEIDKEALDPRSYIKKESINKEKLGWIKGYNLFIGTSCFIPAQLTYLNYLKGKKEKLLSNIISTGAAGGFDHETTLLRGIYEVIERDAFMTIYLNRIKAQRIELSNIEDETIIQIVNYLSRYNLELYLFNITNDLEIPSFLSIIVDKSGLGPAVSLGIKSGFKISMTIVQSIEEALMGRILIRCDMLNNKFNFYQIDSKAVKTLLQRRSFWLSIKTLRNLNFLLKQKTFPLKINLPKMDLTKELNYVKELIHKKGYKIFYVNITPDNFKKIGYLVYKILIPDLQPLYLDENQKIIRYQRLIKVSKFFGQKKMSINKIPHPFI